MPRVGTSAAWSAVPSVAPIAPADVICRNCRRELVTRHLFKQYSPGRCCLEARGLSANVDTAAAAAAEGNANRAGYPAAERRGWPKLSEQKAILDAAAQRLVLLAGHANDGEVDNPSLVVQFYIHHCVAVG